MSSCNHLTFLSYLLCQTAAWSCLCVHVRTAAPRSRLGTSPSLQGISCCRPHKTRKYCLPAQTYQEEHERQCTPASTMYKQQCTPASTMYKQQCTPASTMYKQQCYNCKYNVQTTMYTCKYNVQTTMYTCKYNITPASATLHLQVQHYTCKNNVTPARTTYKQTSYSQPVQIVWVNSFWLCSIKATQCISIVFKIIYNTNFTFNIYLYTVLL